MLTGFSRAKDSVNLDMNLQYRSRPASSPTADFCGKCRTRGASAGQIGAALLWLLCPGLPDAASAQTDYSLMQNWAYHPEKLVNLIADYSLDVAVLSPDMQTDSIITFENRATQNTGTDVFFVHPTYLSGTYAIPENVEISGQPIDQILAGIIAQGGLLAHYGRFYAPFYRQATPPVFLGTPELQAQAAALGTAYGDVRAAFLNYLNTQNGGNDFILAAHSQGAYLLSMLLQDVIAGDVELKSRMVAAVPAGMVSVYDAPEATEGPGGWWNGLELCTEIGQCGCIMTWRTYNEGQTAGSNAGHPAFSPLAVDSGWVDRVIDPEEDWFFQDSLYYGTDAVPLRHYIAPNGGDSYGTGTGFVAFDGLYSIRYQRNDPQEVGFFLTHTPAPGDQRPDDLASEAEHPLYTFWGYHRKDYHIYLWALIEQLNAKLENCGVLSTAARPETSREELRAAPNPASKSTELRHGDRSLPLAAIRIYGPDGRLKKRSRTSQSGSVDLEGLPAGLYLLKSEKGTVKVAVE